MSDFRPSTASDEEEQERLLLQDLRRMYKINKDHTHLFARLEEEKARLASDRERMGQQRPAAHHDKGASSQRDGLSDKSTRWQHINTLVAALFVALLVGSLVIVLNAARHTSTSSPSHLFHTPGSLTFFQMVDTQQGWAMTTTGHVVRTTDGAITWKDVTPPAYVSGQGNAIIDVLNASIVWVVSPGSETSSAQLFHTTDGGQTWKQTPIPTESNRVVQITFIGPQKGWLLASHSIAESAETVIVLHTIDGGETWKQITATQAASTEGPVPGHLPFSGAKTGISFVNEVSGWVTGRASLRGSSFLYRTQDGGVTWSPQTLPLSANEAQAQLSISTPQFFSATDGILLVSADAGNSTHSTQLTVYVTRDGGHSWQGETSLVAQASITSFADLQHGWASDGKRLYVTSDMGKHWTLLPGGPLQAITLLDFVSPTIGWAVGSTRTGSPSLCKTSDGGQTWTVLP
jgi:photosystem II stability/assembly factor-like uncharacterized protein